MKPQLDRLLAASLLLVAGPLCGVAAASAPAWQDKVHPRVLAESTDRPSEFVLVLVEQADLAPAASISTKLERGRWVVETLRALAARTQAPLVADLEARGLEYRALWITNMIWVRGGRENLESLARRSDVLRVDANPSVTMKPLPDVPGDDPPPGAGPVEWNVSQIGADLVWLLGFTGSGVVIGGQDTGYEWTHPALIEKYRGWDGNTAVHDFNWHDAIHDAGSDCGVDSPEPCDDHNHGTHTMGTMVGDDGGSNRIGVAPGARWIGCRNMNEGAGTPVTYSECFQWLIAPTDLNGDNPSPELAPHVINNSWACPPSEGCNPDTLKAVVENTRAAGIVVVSSAGNSGSDCGSVSDPPAIYGASLSIGATNSADQIASFSSRGPVTSDESSRLKPNLSAPGVAVRSSVRNGGYASFSGTSMAGPHVAGLVALLLEARPDLAGNVFEIELILKRAAWSLTSSQDCGSVPGAGIPNNTFGYGRVDAVQTVTGDADGDGTSNLDDCRPISPQVWSLPGAVTDLTLDGSQTTELTWSPPDPGANAALTYDVLRSATADDFSAATCAGANTTDTSAADTDLPVSAFYYLVRTRNLCGSNLGADSADTPRVGASCP